MKRFWDIFLTSFALLFFLPTALVLASWNAIPGDALYPLKTGLEDITLIILSGTPLVPKASMKFTDRRFAEAGALLDKKGSTVGYDLLVAEAQQTQTYIAKKNDVADKAAFIQNIDKYQAQIAKTRKEVASKAGITTNPTAPVAGTPIPTPSGGETVVVTVPTTVVIGPEDPQQIVDKLDDAEKELEKIKSSTESVKDKGDKNNQDHENKGNGNDNPGNGGTIDTSGNKKND